MMPESLDQMMKRGHAYEAERLEREQRSKERRRPPRFGCSCGRRWSGLAECHCDSCHLHFLSVTGFDAHRFALRCRSIEELRERPKNAASGVQRMYETQRMHGTVWVTSMMPATHSRGAYRITEGLD